MNLSELLTLISIIVSSVIATASYRVSIRNANAIKDTNRETNRGVLSISFKQIGKYKIFTMKNTGKTNLLINKITLSKALTNKDVILNIEKMPAAKNYLKKGWLSMYEGETLSANDKITEYVAYKEGTKLYNDVKITIEYIDVYNKTHTEEFNVYKKLFESVPNEIKIDDGENTKPWNTTLNQRLIEIINKLD